MALQSGARLGVYEVTALIGEGGMGQVYRARDTTLNRDVALKVLPDSFATDPDRLARFRREAQVLASLNHPNIAHIHGLEESSGVMALVMELVEGDDLAQRIARRAIPLDEALPIAKQVAEALEAAHERGIVHRDLKPANIKVSADGTVKVLDFGLAKLAEGPSVTGSSVTLSQSPTITTPAMMTGLGMILGTAAYMSPEQAKGAAVDHRADIWAFGAVLYEMITGRRLFSDETASETLAAILKEEPNLDPVPERVRPIVERCLRKDRRKRWQAIGDVRVALEEGLPGVSPVVRVERRSLPWKIATGVCLVAVVALAGIHFREPPPVERALRYTIVAPGNGVVHSLAISPDGRLVVIAFALDGKRQLWLRALDALQFQPMPGTQDASFPFWSSDSRNIGFFAQGKLMRIAAGGGPAQVLCDAPNGRGGSWSRDDVIVFSPTNNATPIQRVSAAGGVPSDVNRPTGNSRFPVFLPDGRHFLYVVTGTSPEIPAMKDGIYLSSLDDTNSQLVLPDVSSVAYARPVFGDGSGWLFFLRNNTLVSQPFDAGSGHVKGDLVPIANDVGVPNAPYSPVTVSSNGVLLYRSGGAGSSSQMTWFDRAGKVLGTVGPPGNLSEPSISPDERTVAFSRGNRGGADIWLWDLARSIDTRLTFDASQQHTALWSPKGDRIAFISNRSGPYEIFQRMASGSGQDESLLSTRTNKSSDQWSRDGRFLVYSQVDPKTKRDLWVLPVGADAPADRSPQAFLNTQFNEIQGQLSPDSRWMAYSSDESGQPEVYVRPFPSADPKSRISTAGGGQPRWRGDGKELFFVAADGKMMAVVVKASAAPTSTFEAGVPVPLFDPRMVPPGGGASIQYSVTADGKRFLSNTYLEATATMLNVVVNWRLSQ